MIKITSFDKDGALLETKKIKKMEPVQYFQRTPAAHSVRVQFDGHGANTFYRCDFNCCGVA